MPASKSRPASSAPLQSGRVNQKNRTRQALIAAALELRDAGRNPTLGEIAEHAKVSRATAYRYFPSVEALVSETATDRGMKPLAEIWQRGQDPANGAGRAARELNELLLRDEIGLHVMERSFMTVWLESARHDASLRPGRRMSYIEPIVDSLRNVLPPAARKRLRQSLAMVMGTEALIALRDIGRASAEEALEASAWSARALVRQALEEALERSGNRVRPRARGGTSIREP
jgi:AcrR family transcriptional regulator